MVDDSAAVIDVLNARLAYYDTGIRVIATERGCTFQDADDQRDSVWMPLAQVVRISINIIEDTIRQNVLAST